VHHRLSVILVEMDQDFGISARRQRVAARAEEILQPRMVVDLAVEDSPHRAVLVRQRLMTPVDVDDAQPASPQCNARVRIDVRPGIVRPAPNHGIVHRRHRTRVPIARIPTDAAHGAEHVTQLMTPPEE
jgi:hypothetical protein